MRPQTLNLVRPLFVIVVELLRLQHILIQEPRRLVGVRERLADVDLRPGALSDLGCYIFLDELVKSSDNHLHRRHVLIRDELLHPR